MNCLQQQNNKMKESIRASIGTYRFFVCIRKIGVYFLAFGQENDTLVGVCLTCLKPGLKGLGKEKINLKMKTETFREK